MKIEETVRSTSKHERDAYVTISDQSDGFNLLTIKDITFGKGEINIEYEVVENFINALQNVWNMHKKNEEVNKQ